MFGPITSTRSIARDDRAVTEVIGAILVFALLVLLLVLIQLNAVPAANKQVEFEHSERVQQDFQGLQEELYRVGATGSDGAVSIETGIVYPSRFFLINPPPSTGAIRTVGPQWVNVTNATAAGNAGDYWTGDRLAFETRGITYTPEYNELPNSGTITWEHSMLFTRFDDGSVLFEDDTGFIDGRQIRLTLLEGDISRSSLSSSIELTPISTQRRAVSLTNRPGESITVDLTTTLDDSQLDALANETHVTDVSRLSPTSIRVTLERGVTYDLRISKVRLGSRGDDAIHARYITDVSGNGTAITEGTSQRLVAEVRDAYDNPVSNVTVANVTTSGTVSAVGTATTDSEGRVELRYEAPADVSGNQDVSVTAYFNTSEGPLTVAQREARFDLTVVDDDITSSSGGNDTGDKVSAINPGANTGFVSLETIEGTGTNSLNLTFRNYGDAVVKINRTRFSYYFADNGNRPTTVSLENSDGDVLLSQDPASIPGDFLPLSPQVVFGSASQSSDSAGQPSATQTVQLNFGGYTGSGSLKGDFFVLSVEFVDAAGSPVATVTYFVGSP